MEKLGKTVEMKVVGSRKSEVGRGLKREHRDTMTEVRRRKKIFILFLLHTSDFGLLTSGFLKEFLYLSPIKCGVFSRSVPRLCNPFKIIGSYIGSIVQKDLL